MMKVLSLNLNGYAEKHGAWDARRELIVLAVQEVQPDFLAFQAVHRVPDIAEGDDQATQIASRLKLYPYVHFQPSITYPDLSAEGSAILSRYPFLSLDCHQFSLRERTEDQNHRVLLHAQFQLPTGPFHLFNAHFSWVDEQAKDNVDETLPVLESFQGQRMLVGDLNATPDSEVVARFKETGWIDAWATLRPEDEGFTFESSSLSKRIDYVWVDQSLRERLHAIRTIADTENGRGARPSDHLGLLVDLSFSVG
jgi:endonuclease/exonuclease/phosphatase family metal-dependent hydrolase